MSENTNNTGKTYADGLWIREKKFDDGSALLNVSVLVHKFSDFIKKHEKTDGFVNIVFAPKREPNSKSTHYAYLDTYVPKAVIASNTKPKQVNKPKKEENSEVDI